MNGRTGASGAVSTTADVALRERVAELIDPGPEQPFGVYLLAGDDPAADIARAVEREVFWEAFGNSAEMLAAEYDVYEPASFFIVAVDHRRCVPAGMIRVVTASAAGFKSLNDIPRFWGVDIAEVVSRTNLNIQADRTWDVATLAVAPEYRASSSEGLVGVALYQALSVAGRHASVDMMVAILDLAVLELLQRTLRFPFEHFAGIGPIQYLDSASSVPVYGHYPTWSCRLQVEDPDTWSMFVEGEGLEAVVSAPDWSTVTSAGVVRRIVRPASAPPGVRPLQVVGSGADPGPDEAPSAIPGPTVGQAVARARDARHPEVAER